ncbi:hydrogenase 4 subunit B [Aliidiomarina sedimenti]|uniref:Hydrogenase 4 subunit B n=1 Tax=Aliidiomarina sedimenti TaxID=1933879 RepID=A0ABY0BZJ1_9GAMM|nr:proton-conducting transporter membrane subunit [Aliidiomarina sedimenti]RUO29962.1 hydrogenase 4 subunit B [Aliidiomarina sedimenti]
MNLIPLLLVIPLAWALLSLLLPRLPIGLLALAGIVLQLGTAAMLWNNVQVHGASSYAIGDWVAPLGITLVADGLTVTLLAMTALIAVVCAFYAIFYLRAYEKERRYFWPLFWFLLAALNGIWLAGDLFNLYVGLELLTLSAVGMVTLSGERHALAAGLRYLYAALLGSLAYLLGVALLYGAYGTLDLGQLSSLLDANLMTQLALALMTFGLLMKTAVFPLHSWLPPAHGGALAPVSAILSALVVKSSFYILARLWMDAGDALMPVSAAQLLGTLGALAIIWGGWQAFRQSEIKMLVAYSTVAQLGYLMLLFPLAIGQSQQSAVLAWQGTMLHLLSHGFAKAAMFLAVGTLVLAVGKKRVVDMAGISAKMPLALFAFGLASISIMGLPPSGGFNAKWLLMQSAIQSGQWHWVAVLLVGSLITASYVFRVFSVSFQKDADPQIRSTHPALDLSALLLAAIAIALGFAAAIPVELLTLPEDML